MNRAYKSIIISGLIFAFVAASMFCCCISDTAHAREIVSECHQKSHEAHGSQDHDSKECACPTITGISIEKTSHNLDLAKISFGPIETASQADDLFVPIVIAHHAPPIVYNTSPLYIKYSVFRI